MTDPGDQLIALIESLYDGVRPPDSDDVARVYDAVHDIRERSAEAALHGFREGASQVAHDRDEKARAASQERPPIDVERLAEAMRRIGYIVYEGDPDDDDMCPNCVTPWKCNGPHILKERPDANDEEAAKLAAEYSRLSGSVGE